MSSVVLSTEVLQIIFNFTTLRDQKSISLVCRRWATAVEPILLARTYLSVLKAPRTVADFVYHNTNRVHIEKNLLVNSSRRYIHVKVEWRTEPNMRALQEVLNVCLERFPVQKLYFKTPFGKALADLLSSQQNLLKNLTELWLEQCDISYEQSSVSSVFLELSLPKLKQLTCLECSRNQNSSTSFYPLELPVRRPRLMGHLDPLNVTFQYQRYELPRIFHSVNNPTKLIITLHVPELDRLEVGIQKRSDSNRTVYLGRNHANRCCLFLPCLNLKSCSQLQHIEISELSDLDQTVIDHSAAVLRNIKSLTLFKCSNQVVEKLCGKCSQLEELTVDTPYCSASLEIFSILPHSLRKLSLKNFPICFSDEIVDFLELRYMHLTNTLTRDNRNKLSINAPNLTTIVTSQTNYNLLRIFNAEQIRTMVVDLNQCNSHDSLPPPNVTELFLCLKHKTLKLDHAEERETVQDYLKHFPNLRRLTIFGKQAPTKIGRVELSLRRLPHLQYLCADGVTLRLADFHELTHLKSLILSDCILKSNPDDDAQIVLQELQYFRARLVLIVDADGEVDRARKQFPICGGGGGDGWLPPLLVKLSSRSFSTRGYRLKPWHQIIPTMQKS